MIDAWMRQQIDDALSTNAALIIGFLSVLTRETRYSLLAAATQFSQIRVLPRVHYPISILTLLTAGKSEDRSMICPW